MNQVHTIKIYKREEVRKKDDCIFVFGDNTEDRTVTKYIPKSTQAVIRGLPNAIGIDTKKDRLTKPFSYFYDCDFETYSRYVDATIKKILILQKEGKAIVFPTDGIGTGKSMLKLKAPLLFEYLSNALFDNFGFRNDLNI